MPTELNCLLYWWMSCARKRFQFISHRCMAKQFSAFVKQVQFLLSFQWKKFVTIAYFRITNNVRKRNGKLFENEYVSRGMHFIAFFYQSVFRKFFHLSPGNSQEFFQFDDDDEMIAIKYTYRIREMCVIHTQQKFMQSAKRWRWRKSSFLYRC